MHTRFLHLFLSISFLLASTALYCSSPERVQRLQALLVENDNNQALAKHASLNKCYPWPDMYDDVEASDDEAKNFYKYLATKNRRQRPLRRHTNSS